MEERARGTTDARVEKATVGLSREPRAQPSLERLGSFVSSIWFAWPNDLLRDSDFGGHESSTCVVLGRQALQLLGESCSDLSRWLWSFKTSTSLPTGPYRFSKAGVYVVIVGGRKASMSAQCKMRCRGYVQTSRLLCKEIGCVP